MRFRARTAIASMILTLAATGLSGCGFQSLNGSGGEGDREQSAEAERAMIRADFEIRNSSGVTRQVTCPGTPGCYELQESLAGRLFGRSPRYRDHPETRKMHESGSIDLTKPQKVPIRIPGYWRFRIGPPMLGKYPYKPGDICFLVKTGEHSIRVRGTINGRTVDFLRDQSDECQAEEYNFWKSLFETEAW